MASRNIKLGVAFLLVLSLSFVAATCSSDSDQAYKPKTEDPEFIHRSVKQVTDRIVHDIFSPPVASRIYAYSSVAGYEALRHIDPSFESFSGQVSGLDSIPQPDLALEYCFPLASVEAYLAIGKTLVFSEPEIEAFHQKILKEFRDTGLPTEVYDRSIEYGNKVAARIIKWSSKDNYKQSRSFPKYTILSDPATWKPTPPAYMDAVEPHWNKIRPFVIDSATQFRPDPAIKFGTDKKGPFYKEALEVYDIGKGLTQEQKEIASFWDCNPFVMNVRGHVMFATKKISPGGHWMNITAVACRKSDATMVQSAEAYARVALSLVDGFISCWDEKFRSKVIRPETYINQYIDENWVPMLQTPPFPEYTSGHSVISAAAAVALTGVFGDNFAFTDSTEVEYGMTSRSFTSFYHAAEEAAESRIYGGIHYRAACDNGKTQGKKLGEFIVNKVKTRKVVSAMK
ncbi:MAG TPA: vanadium-dependent haloperoxidase [Cyclobacteriaceae bacterium]|nr:vanadium-dependent haloperoxidase [Cyclobacteriaceae bacterium]